jgi:hypothetical protein
VNLVCVVNGYRRKWYWLMAFNTAGVLLSIWGVLRALGVDL